MKFINTQDNLFIGPKMEEIVDWAEKNFKQKGKEIPQIKVQKTNNSKIITLGHRF